MADQIGDGVPAQIVTGATTKWRVTFDDYRPSDGWTVKYRVASVVGHEIEYPADFRAETIIATATAEGDAWLVVFTSAQTSHIRPGVGKWQAWAEKGTGVDHEQYLVDSGELDIAGGLDTFMLGTQAEHDLAAVRRALVPATSTGVQEYEINGVGSGRRLRNYSREDLLKLETSLAQRVNAEKRRAARAKGAPYFKTIYPR